MTINSYKTDEQSIETSKLKTLGRLLSYLAAYRKEIVLVLLIMAFGVAVSLLNPLIMESAIDTYIFAGHWKGLLGLISFALALNMVMIITIKIRMYIMAKVCNQILLTIRQELYTHIQTLDFQFFDSRPTGKILARIIGDINSLKDVLCDYPDSRFHYYLCGSHYYVCQESRFGGGLPGQHSNHGYRPLADSGVFP